MADEQKSDGQVSREQLIELLNEDLAREYQAIIAYVVYSQMLKGAEYMAIAKELEKHAGEELQHALTVSKLVDYLGGDTDRHCQAGEDVGESQGHASVRPGQRKRDRSNYRERVRQCEALGEFAMAEHLREILKQEQEHQIDLATALGEDVPDVSKMKGPRGEGQGARSEGQAEGRSNIH